MTRWPFDVSSREQQLLFAWARLDYPDSSGLYVASKEVDAPRFVRGLQEGESLRFSRAVFSFDGSEIVFRDAQYGEVFKQSIQGSNIVQVTHSNGYAGLDCDVDPSGRYLVYTNVAQNETDRPPGPGLRVVDFQTGAETIVVRTDNSLVTGLDPRWSPTGRKIFFRMSDPDDVFFFDREKHETTRITNDRRTEYFVGWEGIGDSFYYVAFDWCRIEPTIYLWKDDERKRTIVHEDLGDFPWAAMTSEHSTLWYYIDGKEGDLESTIKTVER